MSKDEWYVRKEQRLLNQLSRIRRRLHNAKKQLVEGTVTGKRRWLLKRGLSSKAREQLQGRILELQERVDSIQLSLVEMREGGVHEEDAIHPQ